jgi:hypothetical protein
MPIGDEDEESRTEVDRGRMPVIRERALSGR